MYCRIDLLMPSTRCFLILHVRADIKICWQKLPDESSELEGAEVLVMISVGHILVLCEFILGFYLKVLERNRKMLENSDDVVTLPARLILPLLAMLARRRPTEADAAGKTYFGCLSFYLFWDNVDSHLKMRTSMLVNYFQVFKYWKTRLHILFY